MKSIKRMKMLDDIRGAISNYFEFRIDNLSESEHKLKSTYVKSLDKLENSNGNFFEIISELTSTLCEVCLEFKPNNSEDVDKLLPYQKSILRVTGALVEASFKLDKDIKGYSKSRKNKNDREDRMLNELESVIENYIMSVPATESVKKLSDIYKSKINKIRGNDDLAVVLAVFAEIAKLMQSIVDEFVVGKTTRNELTKEEQQFLSMKNAIVRTLNDMNKMFK
ncbi:hypothetical protein PMX22_15725 [Clostridium butyricum]|uniref:hypothetical protein n=1 Tax=Clostridium butyricum TaxID=1492 RepID=UPI00232C2A41|nr:hypothetical protein [Clostridium butyricum]MDB2161246.1 hypothetical protein [Clostridium butyricum]